MLLFACYRIVLKSYRGVMFIVVDSMYKENYS